MFIKEDVPILQKLAREYAEVANLPIQAEKIRLWTKLNGLKMERPMVTIDQLPWYELNKCDELRLHCKGKMARRLEGDMRTALYKWNNFKADMVLLPVVRIPHIIYNFGFGDRMRDMQDYYTDEKNYEDLAKVVSYHVDDTPLTEEQIDSAEAPLCRVDRDADRENFEFFTGVFDGIMPVEFSGVGFSTGVWDHLTFLHGLEAIYYDLADNPKFLHKLVNKYVDIYMAVLDRLEELNLLDIRAPYVHCTGAFAEEIDRTKTVVKAKDVWCFGLAQLFGFISPEMYDEFEIQPVKKLMERFALTYYGCCDPMHDRIRFVKQIKNVRKISISPWADEEMAAKQLLGDYVYSRKPNPAVFIGAFDPVRAKRELKYSLDIAKQYGCNIELIMKDISTVEYHPERLTQWNDLAMSLAEDY